MNKFSTMNYDRKHLIIKSTEGQNSLVIAECYLPGNAQLITELLEKDAAEKVEKEKSNES